MPEIIGETEYRQLAGEPSLNLITGDNESDLMVIAKTVYGNRMRVEEARGIVWRYARDHRVDTAACERLYDKYIRMIAYVPTIGDS